MVEDSTRKEKVNGALNAILYLIPKSNKRGSVANFRPTSLCNLIYKLITKIIATRIKPYLSKGISKEQF